MSLQLSFAASSRLTLILVTLKTLDCFIWTNTLSEKHVKPQKKELFCDSQGLDFRQQSSSVDILFTSRPKQPQVSLPGHQSKNLAG